MSGVWGNGQISRSGTENSSCAIRWTMSSFSPAGGPRVRPSRTRTLLIAAVACLAALLGGASPAFASHLQGGFFTAKVTDTGRLQGTITYLEVYACPSGVGSQKSLPITITSPGGQVVNKSVATAATRCGAGGSTYEGSFDYPLDTNDLLVRGGRRRLHPPVDERQPHRRHRQRRELRQQVRALPREGAQGDGRRHERAVPRLGCCDRRRHRHPVLQNLNASDPDDVLGNGTLTYEALLGDPDLAPNSNVIDNREAPGQRPDRDPDRHHVGLREQLVLRVQGARHRRSGRLRRTRRAPQGRHAESTPVISGLDTTNGYDIAAGATQTITFSATDPDAANTVRITGAGCRPGRRSRRRPATRPPRPSR